MEKICVLAGNREQFEQFLGENGLTDSQAFYAYDETRVLGQRYKEVKVVGTFYERKDASDLKQFAENRLNRY